MATATIASDVIDTVNGLISICRDGEHGFKTASERLEGSDDLLKSELHRYSEQRRDFAQELENALRDMGAEPADSGSITGTLHRGWINIRQAVAGNERKAILSECDRGEEAAVRSYGEALLAPLPSPLLSVVQNQARAVERVHERIHHLVGIEETQPRPSAQM